MARFAFGAKCGRPGRPPAAACGAVGAAPVGQQRRPGRAAPRPERRRGRRSAGGSSGRVRFADRVHRRARSRAWPCSALGHHFVQVQDQCCRPSSRRPARPGRAPASGFVSPSAISFLAASASWRVVRRGGRASAAVSSASSVGVGRAARSPGGTGSAIRSSVVAPPSLQRPLGQRPRAPRRTAARSSAAAPAAACWSARGGRCTPRATGRRRCVICGGGAVRFQKV